MIEQDGYIQNSKLFDRFNRVGQVVRIAEAPRPIDRYKISTLGENRLLAADETVRQVESSFAPEYDGAQFSTPGMEEMARRDTAILEQWISNPTSLRGLDIGPGTGRITLPLADAVGATGKMYGIETAKPYLDRLIAKASQADIDPERLKLAVGDIQNISSEELQAFTDGGELDFATMWFGPLALMTTNPQRVINSAAALLKEGGSLMITTNSLNGLAYRVPEAAADKGGNPQLPLGYRPSIFTRRSFSEEDKENPTGMILGTGQVLPATFYDPSTLIPMLEKAGLEVTDVRGISRLTGLFPADKEDTQAVRKYIDLIASIDESAERAMNVAPNNPDYVWSVARNSDISRAKDQSVLSEFTYPAFRAVKTAR